MVDFIDKVILIREDDVFIPALRVHQPDCDWPRHCCAWETRPQRHLASTNRNAAARAASDLARQIGCRYDGPDPQT